MVVVAVVGLVVCCGFSMVVAAVIFVGVWWVGKGFLVVAFVLLLLWLFVVLFIGGVLPVAFGLFELLVVLRGLLVVCG